MHQLTCTPVIGTHPRGTKWLYCCAVTQTPLTANFLLQVPAQSKLALLRLDACGTNAINMASLGRAIGIVILDKFPGISVAGVCL